MAETAGAVGAIDAPKMESIETPRLVLRTFRESDAQDVFNACSNPVLGHDAGWPPHESVADSLIYINEIAPLGYVWAMTEAAGDDHVIGSIGLLPDPRTPDDGATMMLGYWLAQEKWNRGYTTEAARAVVDWGFSRAGLARITTSHFLFNHASRRVIEKCGFRTCGIAPFPTDDPNEPEQDVQWYEIAAADLQEATR